MAKIIRENRIFLVLYIIQLLVVGVVLLAVSKAEIHLFLNEYHSTAGDIFFKNITHLGDGLTPVFITLLLLFVSFRKAISIGFASALGGLIAQFFKRVVFSDVVRPKAFFEGVEQLYFVPGVDVHTSLSLPSGHTATAFALFFVLATFASRNYLKIGFFVLALLVGYSRVYLSQHFMIDIYVGAFIGIVSGISGSYLASIPKNDWLDRSIFKLKNK